MLPPRTKGPSTPTTPGVVQYYRPTPRRQVARIDVGGVPGLLELPEHDAVQIDLLEQRALQVDYATDGIAFAAAPEVDLDHPGWRNRYDRALDALLRRELGAVDVRVFDHTVRVDDPAAERRPARDVHTDYSPSAAAERLQRLLGKEASAWSAGHYAFVNVWRPISDVVQSAPLAFVRPSTVLPEDWVTLDLIYPDRVGQILGLVHATRHQWLFRSSMTRNDAVLFNVHDNRGRPPVAHSAVDLVATTPPGTVRTSLESRTLVRFA